MGVVADCKVVAVACNRNAVIYWYNATFDGDKSV